jgi:hypothetical protein
MTSRAGKRGGKAAVEKPIDKSDRKLSPAVQRLRGVAAGARAGREDYREHLHRKYGQG